jgi:hypothetical protein
MADQLAKLGSERLFIGPEPACGISMEVARKAARDWTIRDHRKQCNSLRGLKKAKALIQGPSTKKTRELLNLNRDQLQWVVGLLTRHCQLKGQLFKLSLGNRPRCERCLEREESLTHILFDCEELS